MYVFKQYEACCDEKRNKKQENLAAIFVALVFLAKS
jgi:hypothetical protein